MTYACDVEQGRILRVSYLPDRSESDVLAEVEFIHYLAENGAGVADVIPSWSGKLMETILLDGQTYHLCLFERARGDQLADHGYRYREGAPMTEYFYNCGKALGRIHKLSKQYAPVHRRIDFFEHYNERYLDALIPDSQRLLKDTLFSLLEQLRALDRSGENYGLLHFDFSDGNFMIDYQTGDITAFDFDNACYGWYLFDLAGLWTHGTGWVQFEPDAQKRRQFMDSYFATVIAGYRSETDISDEILRHLPLLIDADVMEGIVDELEVQKNEGEAPECDEELDYRFRCIEQGVPYVGFFSDLYDPKAPFTGRERTL